MIYASNVVVQAAFLHVLMGLSFPAVNHISRLFHLMVVFVLKEVTMIVQENTHTFTTTWAYAGNAGTTHTRYVTDAVI